MVELRTFGQLLFQRQQIDLPALIGERAHRGENGSMRVAEKVFRVDQRDHAVKRVVVDQDRTEDCSLSVRALRQRTIQDGVELDRTHWTMRGILRAISCVAENPTIPPQFFSSIARGSHLRLAELFRSGGKENIFLDKGRAT